VRPSAPAAEDRAVTAGLLLTALVLVAGAATENLLTVAAGAASLALVVLVAGSAYRTMMAALGLQICLSLVTLNRAGFHLGPLPVRPDLLALGWVLILWLSAVADGRRTDARPGLSGWLAAGLVTLSALAVLRGLASGNDPQVVATFALSYCGYLFFFPFLWILRYTDDPVPGLVRLLVLFAGLAGLVYVVTGVMGEGMGLYYRATGMRIATRQPNAMAVVLVLLAGLLWRSPRSAPPLLLSIPAGVLMIAGILLSQTRGLWLGIATAAGFMFLLGLFKREREVSGPGRKLMSLLIFGLLVAAGVVLVGSLDLLTAGQLAQRTASQSGSYFLDAAVISRFISWGAVLDKLQGTALLIGHGFGETITYFKPEMGMMWTMAAVDGALFQTALVMGMAGVAMVALLYLAGIVDGARLFLSSSHPGRAALALSCAGAMVVIAVASLFASAATNYRYTVLWALLFAMVRHLRRAEAEDL
jgi:hypothetical protein